MNHGGLTLKDGKFWRNGVEVPPRIGDAEQIALLRREERAAEQREKEANGDGIILKFEPTLLRYQGRFTCICGCGIVENFLRVCCDSMEDIMNDGSDDCDLQCPKCGRKYEIVFGRAVLISEND